MGVYVKKRPAPPGATSHYRRWTPREDERLRMEWGNGTLAEVAAAFGRSRVTVYHHGRALGLPCGAPQGYEYLTAAAKRTGFETNQLRALLTAAHVTIHRTFSRPYVSSKTGRTYHYVLPDDVDDAVAAWARTEMIEPAARARGFIGATLRRWLIAAGHTPPRRAKLRWRVPTLIIDEVVAAQRALVSVRAHARRLGVGRTTLAQKLRAAGVLADKRPGVEVRLPAQVVDRVLASLPVRRVGRAA